MSVKTYASQDWVMENTIQTPTTAAIGQILAVKAVDESGKPIEWGVVTLGIATDENGVMTITMT